MTFNNLTQADAIRIRDILKQLDESESTQANDIYKANKQVAMDWWNTIKPTKPTTREEALSAYQLIEGLIQTETDDWRIRVLKEKLIEANEKFKERKRNG